MDVHGCTCDDAFREVAVFHASSSGLVNHVTNIQIKSSNQMRKVWVSLLLRNAPGAERMNFAKTWTTVFFLKGLNPKILCKGHSEIAG